MRYPIETRYRLTISALSVTAMLTLGACNPQRESDLTQSESTLMLEEIGISESMIGYEEHRTTAQGPMLIAGDWLAFQCAYAGDYFDGFEWAPVYANVDAGDFE